MFHFKLLLIMTTLCLSLSSNALPLASTRQVDAAHNEIARNGIPDIEPRFPKGKTAPSVKPPPPVVKPPPAIPPPPAAKPPPANPPPPAAKPPPANPPPPAAKPPPANPPPVKTTSPVKTLAAATTSSVVTTTAAAKTTTSLATPSVAKSSVATSVAALSSAAQSSSVVKSVTASPPPASSALATSSLRSVSSSRVASSSLNASSTPANAVKSSSTLPPSAQPTSNGTQVTTANNATQTNGASCALPAPSTKKPAVASAKKLRRRVLLAINRLLGRDKTEFIGFHGTNSDTATFWAGQGGKITKPPGKTGILDFLGLTPAGDGTSGADAELGPGLYVADEPIIAQGFANGNAQRNPGTTAQVCAIFAASSGNWRQVIPKVFIPQQLVGDSGNKAVSQKKENNRLTYIKNIGVATTGSAVVKFSLLDTKARTGQMSIPSVVTNQFTAKCFDAGTDIAKALPGEVPDLTTFGYDSQALRTAWNIKAENQAVANSIASCNP